MLLGMKIYAIFRNVCNVDTNFDQLGHFWPNVGFSEIFMVPNFFVPRSLSLKIPELKQSLSDKILFLNQFDFWFSIISDWLNQILEILRLRCLRPNLSKLIFSDKINFIFLTNEILAV